MCIFPLFPGVEPANPNLKVLDLTDIKVLDGLLRAHVLLAELVGRGSPQYADYLLMAHAYILKLWQASDFNPFPHIDCVPHRLLAHWWKTNDACHSNFCQTSERMLAELGFKLTTP